MIRAASRIYISANAAVVLILLLNFDPWERASLALLTLAIFFSLLLSFPAIPLLGLLFSAIRQLRLSVPGGWIVLIAATPLIAFVPGWLLNLIVLGLDAKDNFWPFTLLGTAGGYLGMLVQCRSIHQLFQSFQHDKEEEPADH